MVVGINDYPKLPKFKYAVNDAKEFHRLLIEKNRVPAENITLLINEQATLKNLRSALGIGLKSAAGPDDMVIIFFAGHGATERDAASPDGDGLEKYILAFDTDPEDLFSTALPMRDIALIFNRIRSERLSSSPTPATAEQAAAGPWALAAYGPISQTRFWNGLPAAGAR